MQNDEFRVWEAFCDFPQGSIKQSRKKISSEVNEIKQARGGWVETQVEIVLTVKEGWICDLYLEVEIVLNKFRINAYLNMEQRRNEELRWWQVFRSEQLIK